MLDRIDLAMVPRVGIEPTLLSEPDFESGASTSSTTEAREQHYTRTNQLGSITAALMGTVFARRHYSCAERPSCRAQGC